MTVCQLVSLHTNMLMMHGVACSRAGQAPTLCAARLGCSLLLTSLLDGAGALSCMIIQDSGWDCVQLLMHTPLMIRYTKAD